MRKDGVHLGLANWTKRCVCIPTQILLPMRTSDLARFRMPEFAFCILNSEVPLITQANFATPFGLYSVDYL